MLLASPFLPLVCVALALSASLGEARASEPDASEASLDSVARRVEAPRNATDEGLPCVGSECVSQASFTRGLSLIAYARNERVPEALLVAARELHGLHLQRREATLCGDCSDRGLTPAAGPVLEPLTSERRFGELPTTEALLIEAEAMARDLGRPLQAREARRLRKRGFGAARRGAVGGVVFSLSELKPYTVDVHQFTFEKDETARVCMATAATDGMSLYAYDNLGNQIDHAEAENGSVCLSWTPRRTAEFDLIVQNTGETLSAYYVYTN